MESERTMVIFFEDFTKAAQKKIIAYELGRITGDEGVSHITVKVDENTFELDPDKPTSENYLHVKARYNGHDHRLLMVWDCMKAEFTNITEDNQV